MKGRVVLISEEFDPAEGINGVEEFFGLQHVEWYHMWLYHDTEEKLGRFEAVVAGIRNLFLKRVGRRSADGV